MSEESFELKYYQLQDFLASVAHELRTPLNGIAGLSDILLDNEKDLTRAKHLKMVNSCATRLISLTNEIVDMAAYRSGKIKLNVSKNVQLNDLCENVYELILHSVDSRGRKVLKDGVKFEKSLSSNLPLLEGDSDRLTQVIHNVVSNSLKFTNSGFVRLTTQFDGSFILFSCLDSGKGIRPENLSKIFEPFCQEEEGTGLGLGLSIASRIMELHGGTIWAESMEGKGSQFYIRLPLVMPPMDDSPRMYFTQAPIVPPSDDRFIPIIASVRRLFSSVESLTQLDTHKLEQDLANIEEELDVVHAKLTNMLDSTHKGKDDETKSDVSKEEWKSHQEAHARQIAMIIELESTRDKLIEDNRTLIWRMSDMQSQSGNIRIDVKPVEF